MRISKLGQWKLAGAVLVASALLATPSFALSVGVGAADLYNHEGMNGGPNMTQGEADSSGSVPLRGEEPWRPRESQYHRLGHVYIYENGEEYGYRATAYRRRDLPRFGEGY